MLTASCPKCAKQVTVPSAARPESRVRCPLCAEEYTLESVFADLPPLLVLLDVPAPNGMGQHGEAAAASASGVGGSSSIFDFDERQRHDAEAADADTAIALADAEDVAPQSHGFDFGGANSPAAESIGTTPRTTTTRPKPKKKTSPLKSIIGVVVGGIVALPLAQLILWYLPGGWDVGQRDPMEIGRKYPTTFGMLAPSWVKNSADPIETANNGEPQPGPLEKPPENALDKLDPAGQSLGRNDLNNALTGGSKKPPEPSGSGDDAEDEPLVVDDGSDDGGEKVPPIDTPNIDEPPARKSPVKDAPTFTSSDLANELKIAKEARGLIDTAAQPEGDGQTKREAAETFLSTMSQLAKVVTFADKRPAGHMEHVHELLATAADTSQKRKIVSTLASLEFGKPHSQPAGTIFMGTVREIQQRGRLFETIVDMSTSTQKPVSVYTSDDPQGAIAAGNTVVVLGVIVDQPNQNITGYKGEPDPVVWGGYWQVVPVEE